MSLIQQLPVELLLWLVRDLDLVDAVNLGMTCWQLWAFVNDYSIARTLLRIRAPFSKDFRSVPSPEQCPSALRTMLKRQAAVSNADPFTVAVVAKANSFVLANGLLAYTAGAQLRLLPIYNPRGLETVIDMAKLVNTRDPPRHLRFTPVHYNHGILTCVHQRDAHRKSSHVLVVLDVRKREILCSRPIASVRLLFVRNNPDFLVYGSYSEYAVGGPFLRWVVWVLDLRTMCWKEQRRILPDLVGSSPGATISFEIVDDHLLALSSRTRQEAPITSSYYAVRFPLEDPALENVHETSSESMYRRKTLGSHTDDRWNLLKIQQDVVTGKWLVREVRKEWEHQTSEQSRGLWEREITFPAPARESDAWGGVSSPAPLVAPPLDRIPVNGPCPPIGSVRALVGMPPPPPPPPPGSPGSREPVSPEASKDLQIPKRIHFTNDGESINPATGSPYHFTDMHLHAYVAESQTFLDILNGGRAPEDSDRCPPLELRLRAISAGPRRLSPLSDNQGDNGSSSGSSGSNKVSYWPPRDGTFASEHLLRLLNPQSKRVQSFETAFEESSATVVYGSADRPARKQCQNRARHLVLVSFDPSVQLAGLPKWKTHPVADETETPPPPSRRGCQSHAKEGAPTPFGWNDDSVKLPLRDWVSVEKAMYLTIAGGRNENEGTTYGYDFTAQK